MYHTCRKIYAFSLPRIRQCVNHQPPTMENQSPSPQSSVINQYQSSLIDHQSPIIDYPLSTIIDQSPITNHQASIVKSQIINICRRQMPGNRHFRVRRGWGSNRGPLLSLRCSGLVGSAQSRRYSRYDGRPTLALTRAVNSCLLSSSTERRARRRTTLSPNRPATQSVS